MLLILFGKILRIYYIMVQAKLHYVQEALAHNVVIPFKHL